jgi:V/A-type H+-transporting ATPase subunit A
MVLSVSPPGGDFTEPVTQACLRTTGAFLMLDTSLAHSRHFPAINWSQSYSLYSAGLGSHFREKVSSEWELFRQRCREVLQQEESLREVAEIVGPEGLQESDRLLMLVAEKIRAEFLSQNAYTEDAFSPPEETCGLLGRIFAFHDSVLEKMGKGLPLADALKTDGKT